MGTDTAVDGRFVQRIGDRDFVRFEGLLDLAHRQGLQAVETELIPAPAEVNGQVAICRAVVTTERGTFSGIGDACRGNVNPRIVPHIIRMSETRAVARALRLACNIGMCSVEELGGDVEAPAYHTPGQAPAQAPGGRNGQVHRYRQAAQR